MVGVKIECEGVKDMFVVVDGVRIARRGYPGTPQAGTCLLYTSPSPRD